MKIQLKIIFQILRLKYLIIMIATMCLLPNDLKSLLVSYDGRRPIAHQLNLKAINFKIYNYPINIHIH